MAFYEKRWWKEFIHKLYSWGASVVLIGALFKITHWPGANLFLTLGLVTEAVIFFFSGIEPAPEELDWTLVYPELAGLKDEEELGINGRKSGGGSGAGIASTEALAKFEEMIEKAGEQGLFEKLHTGLNNFNTNLEKLQDITDASLATKEFSEKVKSAAESVASTSEELTTSIKTASQEASGLGNAYKQSSEQFQGSFQSLNYAVDNFADAVNKNVETISSGSEELKSAYQKLTESMNIDFSSLSEGNQEYNTQISQLNKNLSAINAIFEMQLGEANLEEMVKDISESAEHAKKYSTEIQKLSKNLAALNDVYGKMLSAMNVKLD